jgi:phosphate-selective porin
MRVCLTVILCVTAPALAHAQSLAEAAAATGVQSDLRARALPSPQLRVGDRFTAELIVKLQTDLNRHEPEFDGQEGDADWRRRRLGVRGQMFGWFSFEIEHEFRDRLDPWRDVYANAKVDDWLEIRGGLFKVPFSLDNLTGSTNHDFISRSVAARTMAPGRHPGLMVSGRSDRRRFTYAVGIFKDRELLGHDAVLDDDKGAISLGATFSTRVTVQPFDTVNRFSGALRNLEIGVNAGTSKMPEGLNSLRGRSVYGFEFFSPVYVKGRRVRTGVDATLFAGPASVKTEWLSAWDQRRNQGLADVDLPSVVSHGWYTSGTWLFTGERKDSDVRPRRPLFQGGIGAVEAAVRFEQLAFGSADTNGEPAFANPRAANLLRNRDDVLTMGVNWYLNRWFKVQFDSIREAFEDSERSPLAAELVGEQRSFWSYVTRLQFAF